MSSCYSLLEWGVVVIVLVDFENYAGISLMTGQSYLSIPLVIGTSPCLSMKICEMKLISTLCPSEMKYQHKKLMEFLHQSDLKKKYGIERNISHKTACQYLHTLGYHYKATLKGLYADGHERADVMFY
jgi:hypothetical protein